MLFEMISKIRLLKPEDWKAWNATFIGIAEAYGMWDLINLSGPLKQLILKLVPPKAIDFTIYRVEDPLVQLTRS